MNRRLYYYPLAIVILAVLFGLFGWLPESTSIRWIAPAFGLALIGLALGLNGSMIALNTDRRLTEIAIALARIEDLQQEINKEQQQRTNQGPPIIASLQAMSQYYMEYLNRRKEEDKK
jgi:hypothetical protein